mgnify:CR=1 FL=1
MEHVATYLTELIGNTPLLELTHWQARHGLKARVLAKLEYMNPLGSVKDRVAAAMIDEGIRQGEINKYGHHRTDERQYRHRPGPGRRREGPAPDLDHARYDEPGTA